MLRNSWFKKLATTFSVAALMATATADEGLKEKRVEIRVEKSSTQQDDNEPEIKGRIVIRTPDGVQEFNLDEGLPADLPVDLPVNLQKLIKGAGKGSVAFAHSAEATPRLMIGLQLDDPSPALRSQLSLDGVALIVTKVRKDLPAAKAGMQEHDIILGVNGKSLEDQSTLNQAVADSGGEAVTINGLRGGKEFTVSVKPQKHKRAGIRIQPRRLNINSLPEGFEGFDGLFKGGLEPGLMKGIRIQPGQKIDPAQIEELMKEALQNAEGLKDIDVRVETEIKKIEDDEKTLRDEVRALQQQLDRLTRSLDGAVEEETIEIEVEEAAESEEESE